MWPIGLTGRIVPLDVAISTVPSNAASNAPELALNGYGSSWPAGAEGETEHEGKPNTSCPSAVEMAPAQNPIRLNIALDVEREAKIRARKWGYIRRGFGSRVT